MSLRTKFNLVLGMCMLAGLLAIGIVSHKLLQNNAREEVEQSANIMMESALAVRKYTVEEIKPLLKVQQRRLFLPQTVPAYAANRYIKKFQEEHPEYSYREAALNPTNPANRAADWEADIISWFKKNEDEKTITGERITTTGRSLYFGRPLKITNPDCLSCHGSPTDAPQTFLNIYGSANGFGWKLGEINGVQLVTVPMEVPLARADKVFTVFIASVAGIFLLIFTAMNLLLHRIVIKPITIISARADEVSMGALDSKELEVRGKDEIATLSRSFNRMQRSLSNAVELLDQNDEESLSDSDADAWTRVVTKKPEAD